jgi:uncharacterized membrane protein YfcA
MDNLLLFELVIFFGSGLAHGILGFGFPMVATPLLSLFMSIKESVLYTLFPTMMVNANVIKKSGRFKEIWREYKYLIISVLFGSFIGTNFLIIFYHDSYRILLALVILLYLNSHHIKLSLYDVIQQYPKTLMISFGFVSGIVSGLVNIMIPVLIIYILESRIEKAKSLVVMNGCFFASKFLQILIFGSYGSFSVSFLLLMIPIVIFSLLGLFLGSKIRDRVDENLYKKLLRFSLWILAFYLIFQYLYM